ncbi:hypothetical protein BDY24DRAFT_436884 [Mrakia frigida]|uniref:uncharacterized protein n=1 Tax=Mrakia frigida TaxID=29902 RepID=UPI003FCC07A0
MEVEANKTSSALSRFRCSVSLSLHQAQETASARSTLVSLDCSYGFTSRRPLSIRALRRFHPLQTRPFDARVVSSFRSRFSLRSSVADLLVLTPKHILVKVMKDKNTWILTVGYMGLTSAGTISYFFPTLMVSLGYSGTQANLMTAPIYVCCLVVCVAVGFSSDRFNEKPYHIAGCAVVSCHPPSTTSFTAFVFQLCSAIQYLLSSLSFEAACRLFQCDRSDAISSSPSSFCPNLPLETPALEKLRLWERRICEWRGKSSS